MIVRVKPLNLTLARPFGISRWTKTMTRNVLVEIEQDGIVGFGEGAPNERYGESQEGAIAFLDSLELDRYEDPGRIEEIMWEVDGVAAGQGAAKAALDLALHDWWGKNLDLPLSRLWGVASGGPIATSFTIGLDEPEEMAARAAEVSAEFGVLKVKLGSDRDREIIEAIRRATRAPLRVDANEGWKEKEFALEMIGWLSEQQVELVEQPMPASQSDDMRWLRERVAMPLIADESCTKLDDLPLLAGAFDGINIKLDKCGGLLAARQLMWSARQAGLTVMVGCMVASSLAVTAAAHLALSADFADLDGHLLLAEDPFTGVRLRAGRLELPERPGIGAAPRALKE